MKTQFFSKLKRLWSFLLFTAVIGLADGLWALSKNVNSVFGIDSLGITAFRAIKAGCCGGPTQFGPQRLFLTELPEEHLEFFVWVFGAWFILGISALAGYGLIRAVRYFLKRNHYPTSTSAEYPTALVFGLLGLFIGLISGGIVFNSYSPWIWMPSVIICILIGFGVIHVLPKLLQRVYAAVLFSMEKAAFVAGPIIAVSVVTATMILAFQVWFLPHQVKGPNVIVFIIDTLREDALGICGGDSACSDRIDRFFKDGLQITGVHSDSPWTAPSFASFFTGLSPSEHGVVEGEIPFSPEHDTLAGVLKKRDFWCGALMCNPVIPEEMGFDRGFDVYHNRIFEWKADSALRMGLMVIPVLKRQKRFFLTVQFMDCHDPYVPDVLYDGRIGGPDPEGRLTYHAIPWEYKDSEKSYDSDILSNHKGLYLASLRDVDRAFGEMMKAYESAGLLENTVVVLTSDHGEEFREHGSLGHCVTLYEETTRIPILIKGGLSGQGLIQRQGHLSDLGTTLLNAMAVPEELGKGQCLITKNHPDRAVLLETRRHGFVIGAVVQNGIKYIAPLSPTDQQLEIEHYYPRPWNGPEIYDLEADPAEQRPIQISMEQEEKFKDLWSSIVMRQMTQSAPAASISDETRDALKTLGYIQ
ncbi:MAG: sulfatase [bacterium]